MKRTAIDNPKFKKLAKLLDVPFYSAVGICELLWHFTAKHAPEGDVGRWDDLEVAAAVEWNSDAKVLISSLIDSGLVDVCSRHRLVVHDWEEHCDQSVERVVAKRGYGFCKAIQRPAKRKLDQSSSKLDQTSARTYRLVKARQGASFKGGVGEKTDFDRFWEVYPRREGKKAARSAFERAASEKPAAEIVAAASMFAASPKAQGDYVPHPTTWLNQGRYDDDPAQWARDGDGRDGPAKPARQSLEDLIPDDLLTRSDP